MNFILRKVTDNGTGELNFMLGPEYSLELRHNNPELFNERHKDWVSVFPEDIYGMISHKDSAGETRFLPLYSKQGNYIMTDSGQTFSNVSSGEYRMHLK